MGGRPIANKYREGKMKRTLKREFKGPEIAKQKRLVLSNENRLIQGQSGGRMA